MTEHLVNPELLRKIPIFKSLTDAELLQIINSPQNGIEEYESRQTIVRESEIGTCMYVVLEGSVEVSIRGADASGREISIGTLRKGDFFGDHSLETDTTGRRDATVRAYQKARLLRIEKDQVELCLKRDTGDAKDAEDAEEIPLRIQSPQDREIRALMQGMRLFQALKQSELNTIGSWTRIVTVGPGDFVLKESDKGDCLYVVLEGKVEICTFDEDGKIILLAELERGDHFGEQSLMPGSSGKRNAYARSNGGARLIQVPKAYFRLILNRDGELAQALRKIGESQRNELDNIQKR